MRVKLSTYLVTPEQIALWNQIKAKREGVPDSVILRDLIVPDEEPPVDLKQAIQSLAADVLLIKNHLGLDHVQHFGVTAQIRNKPGQAQE